MSEKLDAKRTDSGIARWLLSQGFVRDGGNLCISFDPRSGYDFTSLEFYPLLRFSGDQGWDAIISCHAGGENPGIVIGRCETLAEVQMVYETVRAINDGYDPTHGKKYSLPDLS